MKAFYILIRFSILSKQSRGWEIANKSYDEYRDELYGVERLESKIRFFKEVTLPSLDAQIIDDNNNNKYVYLMVGENMPSKYKVQIEALKSHRNWLKIVYISEDNSNIFSFFDEELSLLDENTIYATIRLDDDDALSLNYFKKLSHYLIEENVDKVVSFTNGIAGFWSNDLNSYSEFYNYKYPLIALGMAYIQKKKKTKYSNIYRLGSHTKVAERVDVIYDESESMYIRTFHDSSDSFYKQKKAILDIKKNNIAGYKALKNNYPHLEIYFVNYLSNANAIYRIPLLKGGELELKIEGIERLQKDSLKEHILVGFSAAISNRSKKKGPFFSGKGIAKNLDLPLLSFADPIVSDTTLPLGWYLGGASYPNLQYLIASIIDYYMVSLNVKAILLGGSGGGFAGLSISSMLSKGVEVIAMNPQTDIFNYYSKAYDNFLKTAFDFKFLDLTLKEKKSLLLKNNIRYYTKVNDHLETDHTIHYVQNLNDDLHFQKHFSTYIKPIFSNSKQEVKNINLIFSDFGNGHIAPSVLWIEKYLKENILDKTNANAIYFKRFYIDLHGVKIYFIILSSRVIYWYESDVDIIGFVTFYLIENNKIKKDFHVLKKLSYFEYSFGLHDNKFNIFLSIQDKKISKSIVIS